MINLKILVHEIAALDNFIAFVTGPTGAGKSTFVSNMDHKKLAFGVHPGQEVRKSQELKKAVLSSENPTAPKATESFVRELVKKKIQSFANRTPLFSAMVDGMPRTTDQVTWCVDLSVKYKKRLVFIYMDADPQERRDRLILRGDAPEFVEKRLVSDDLVLPAVVSRIKQVVYGGKFGFFYQTATGGVVYGH